MDLRTFYLRLTVEQRDEMARGCHTTPGHLRNVAYGRQPGETLTMDIDRFTNGVVPCEELRPDLADRWAYLRASRTDVPDSDDVGSDAVSRVECGRIDPRKPDKRQQVDRRKSPS